MRIENMALTESDSGCHFLARFKRAHLSIQQHMSATNCFNGIPLVTTVVDAARVFHVGVCGMHTKESNCDPAAAINSEIRHP